MSACRFPVLRVLFLAVTAATLSACVARPKPVIPSVEAGTTDVVVVPLMERDAVAIDFDPDPFFALLGSVVPPVGIGVGAGLDGALSMVHQRRVRRASETVLAAFGGRHTAGHFLELIEPLRGARRDADVTLSEMRYGGNREQIARDVLTESGADAVVIVDAAYRISETGNQFIVTLLQRTFTPGRRYGSSQRVMQSEHTVRRYTYLSPKHALVRRPFRPGEKARYRDEIVASYAEALENAKDPKALLAARDEELAEFDATDTVPVEVAVAEIWTPGRIDTYFTQAREHLREMLVLDWRNESAPPDLDALESIRVVPGKGKAVRVTVYPIRETDTHRIVRDGYYGNMYAIPKAAETGLAAKKAAEAAAEKERRRPCVVSTKCGP